MSAIEHIRARLQRHPHLKYEQGANSLTISPESPDGFPVSLHEDGKRFVVGFGGWHEHFETESEALDCFAFGLSEQCRLRVTSRGVYEYRWTVQRLIDGAWRDDSETGLLFFPFWRRRIERCYQNRVIRDAQ